MVQVRYGGKNGQAFNLELSSTLLAVRTRGSAVADAPLSEKARELVRTLELQWADRTAGVEVLRAPEEPVRDDARAVLNEETSVQFAGRVLHDPASGSPVVYTENLFVKFHDDQSAQRCAEMLARHKLTIKRTLGYATNAYFAAAPDGIGLAVFDIAEALLNEPEVELCHPELVREKRHRKAFPQQWHLWTTTVDGQLIDQSANVVKAWPLARGTGIVIAIIDEGIDLKHPEFQRPGKIVAPRDVTQKNDNPWPRPGEDHGTCVAGLACADGEYGASGVAPASHLMPIRLASALGSQDEADSFYWAATHGADIISCSWGPPDGNWKNPADPAHFIVYPQPDSTRLAIEFAVTKGRGGKGCVIFWAAGNGNESVDNDHYASNPNVIACAAVDAAGVKANYSDHGNAIWCCFPSSEGGDTTLPSIWTTDLTGIRGDNRGGPHDKQGDPSGNYTNQFGGTSACAPGAGGTAALILERNPSLTWEEVRGVLRRSSDKIDEANGEYDAKGHSVYYGYGRVNAQKAVEAVMGKMPIKGEKTSPADETHERPVRRREQELE